MIRNSEASEQAAALPADSIVVERDDGLSQIGLCDDADELGALADAAGADRARRDHWPVADAAPPKSVRQ